MQILISIVLSRVSEPCGTLYQIKNETAAPPPDSASEINFQTWAGQPVVKNCIRSDFDVKVVQLLPEGLDGLHRGCC